MSSGGWPSGDLTFDKHRPTRLNSSSLKSKGTLDWIPHELVAHVTAGCGVEGKAWLQNLPEIISRLENLWSIKVSDPFPSIEFNFVAPAVRGNGEDVVLKIAAPWDPIEIFGEAEY